ncbi:putative myosin class ii heavy chain protein [Rosellinia necatrix]|uniref:Putative myosin class ii heavy chain protein n=1 Tax=Rosellinia necatrix TaxID=77044 RepID=A0A1W2TTF9_ROSNE|nr:putative myosin class ii heavy chain protein [Rosellinia necatrix]
MDSLEVKRNASQDAASIHTFESNSDFTPGSATPTKLNDMRMNGPGRFMGPESILPTTPAKPTKQAMSQTPRLKKKVPWKGKNILVLLPHDEERGQLGKAPLPLDAASTEAMLRSWEELGYDIRGFDLDAHESAGGPENNSRSRVEWPMLDEIAKERLIRQYTVTLPDLNAWRNYVNELAEAKLRALGVTFAEEEPMPPPSVSPAMSNMNQQIPNQFNTFPFSPPLPTSSAGSNGPQGFPFQAPFLQGPPSASQSPGIPMVGPTGSFAAPAPGRFNSRASISISPHELPFHLSGQPSPRVWSPQMLLHQQQLGRNGSPSLHNIMSPAPPFSPDGMSSPIGIHQRHQSLQYPMLPHQFLQRQDSARASPRLQEVREDEEEEETQTNPYDKSPSKTPEPAHFVHHNASDSLQKEIDEAEYHLEEQFRSQLEHEDYSPHNEVGPLEAEMPMDKFVSAEPLHARGPSVHFSGIGTDSDDGPKLHHPQPHSRGHSLSQQPFFDNDEVRDSTDESSIRKLPPNVSNGVKTDSAYEAEPNPGNLVTAAQPFGFSNPLHHRSLSIASNPWAEAEPFSPSSQIHSRQGSHNSKTSLSKLNAGAAEFKFKPKANLATSQFVFGGRNPQAPSFTPASYTPPAFVSGIPQSATSSHFSVPSTGSSTMTKINPAAPVFSPKKSDFSFSTSGPKFNPDAKAFQPMSSFASSIASGSVSGNRGNDVGPKPIFGNIDLSSSEYGNQTKKSKAIPIMQPSIQDLLDQAANAIDTSATEEKADGGASRAKKQFRNGVNGDDDDVPRFAEPTPEPESTMKTDSEPAMSDQAQPISNGESALDDAAVGVKEDEDEAANLADVTLASTVVSESTDGKPLSESNDTKATTSPSATSPDPDKSNWRPIEFTNTTDIHDFNNARPFGDREPFFKEMQKPNFSATARPFIPAGFRFGNIEVNVPFEPDFERQPELWGPPPGEPEEDRGGSPTPGPDVPLATVVDETQGSQQDDEVSADPAPVSTKGLLSSRFASPPPPSKGLKASRFASSPSGSPESFKDTPPHDDMSPSPVSERQPPSPARSEQVSEIHEYEPLPVSPPSDAGLQPHNDETHELTFEEIDAVMQEINEKDPTMGVKRTVEAPKWRQPSPVRKVPVPAADSSPAQLRPQAPSRSDGPSPSPGQYQSLPQEHIRPKPSTELDDPFIDPSHSTLSQSFDGPIQRLNRRGDLPESEWDDAFTESEQGKLEQRVHYFDGHVNDLVGSLLASRLDPLENKLSSIHQALAQLSQRAPSSRRDRRSFSAEFQESDADDEDEELPMRRSTSPKRDRRLEQIRVAIVDAMNQHQAARALESAQVAAIEDDSTKDESTVMRALEDMKLQITQSMPNFNSDELRNIVDEAVKNRMPPTPPVVETDLEVNKTLAEMQSKIEALQQRAHAEESRYNAERQRAQELEEKLRSGEHRVEAEIATRRSAEDRAAELRRQLEQAETKVEVEIMNRSIFDQRIHDLEDRLKTQESKTELELSSRREAEDRLSEIQRLLRISSEEEDRLRAVVEERDQRIKTLEQSSGKTSMRLALLDAAQANAEQTQAELKNRLNAADTELRDARQEARHWRSEAEQARDSAARQSDDFMQAANENKHLHKLIDTLGVQLDENERIRDNWRAKFVSLQDDMAHAAREITEENSRRSKKEQALIARHEVLDARLQAEARTRERLEIEVERLENGERAGMRAVSECKRLEGLLADLRNENHDLHQQAHRAQREAQEARNMAAAEKQSAQLEIDEANELAAIEVRRAQLETQDAKAAAIVEAQQVRESIAVELEAARDQVNISKVDFEEELAKTRAELDQVRLDADTANAHHEMMLEEAQNTKEAELQTLQITKAAEIEDLSRKHQNELEDVQTRYERQISNATEDAQRTEQNLLERLSLSASKIEHLQDRVAHLEEKVQIAQEAAKAAAQAASHASRAVAMPELAAHPGPAGSTRQLAQAMQLPEKISPQALRESIMVLQEQLQAREQRIEELEQKVADLDPDAATKIAKRDDEIIWLRELLAVRHGDLQDIIVALSTDRYDREAVKDATIRLKANLQMEEQERERAMNGGSALNLPNIAATISKAATPRVAQAVGPLAAAWGSWRRSNQSSQNTSGFMSSPAPGRNATPSKSNALSSQNGLLGLMTPPTSGIRSTPQAESSQPQPTAFGNTGRRYTAEQFANRNRGPSITARQAEKMPLASTPPLRQDRKDPRTPPMMQSNSYDDDARMEEFDDTSFFED